MHLRWGKPWCAELSYQLVIFNTFTYYLVFLIPCALLFRHLSTSLRPWCLVFFGIIFYISFSLEMQGGLLGAVCVLLLLWEAWFSRFYKPDSWLCLLGIGINLCTLAVFKYWNFLTGIVTIPLGHNPLHWMGAFLPLGISFFTFEFIHYAADRYRGKTGALASGDYLAFLFFFPTMIAGPIKRVQNFAPCLANPNDTIISDWNRGLTRILTGLVKKFAVADLLTSLTDHLNASDIATADRWVLPLWLLAYGFKIYFDFSAYSDIAIGSSRLFGIRVPENFDWPYLRTNITDFWRSWHRSLYQWLVDYVFIPLGGSKGPAFKTYRNVILTLLASGIWHGAAWNFILWGLYHGCLLSVHRAWQNLRPEKQSVSKGPIHGFMCWFLTFSSVTLGWGLFAMDLPTASLFFHRLFIG